MTKRYVQEFKRFWVRKYAKQFVEAKKLEEKREIKNNVYKNINMTEDEKDEVWNLIMWFSFLAEEGDNIDEF